MKNKQQCLEVFEQLDLTLIAKVRPESDMGYYCLAFTLLSQEIKEAKKPKLFNFSFTFEMNQEKHYQVKLTDYFAKVLNGLLKSGKIPGYMSANDAIINHDEKNVFKKIKTEQDAINFVRQFNKKGTVNVETVKLILEQVRPYVEKIKLEQSIDTLDTLSIEPKKTKLKV